ncbi:hypothetical protein DRE_00177 [Drechslerella stenobrocha 248]|uniref:Uncharacterized protein n=1 Tax=Drechslerella stenobrocha 248 TaxID=1043628 RepID=W7I9U9_9PEZI|nr:hypothetical protein DRE_00177 [Drechslerella stenobrocha 248]
MSESTPSLVDLSVSQTSSYLAFTSSDDVASIDSEETEQESDAELEWQESLKQLELLLTMVIVPFAGKWLGRRCAFWVWARFMQWKYPVDVVITSKTAFRVGGAAAIASAAVPL